ncbi:four helix bundle protein [Vibrio aphrogenes]|uniref:four helix bundle protein n=1 Tax=Vibrio aphrogenes TaxID=1891186 RepID=UPI000B363131|nr:four helix bundle protein [Vibrio aphrogenes]
MRFENLDVWQKSVDLSCTIYLIMKNNRDFGFKDQICRSAVSVASNIAEGYERIHKKETINFLSIAKGSIGELKTQIIIGARVGYISSPAHLIKECELIARMLGSLIQKLKHS